ncbi:type II toxin-antitoxin system VapB family antitoxin [Rhizobium sp. XQZ8]|uniref:type II toxin-antitoxin system VapB family antitoxin n=1 Tax=Rhizobium populisoli TaxID=2859785 RepID=UPI001C68614D|nr:type II toxin-antitoxin system VapB family antitoxin [Rhizobium populisoli]MBW6420526.1 type II toxin-antitoxin system VapB family antitoxin [Rhizobium populisoli]
MPLYVRDERVNQLAEQAQKILKAPTKTDAIRQALERVVETSEDAKPVEKPPLAEQLKAIQDEVKRLGTPNLDFDEKAYLDEMWGRD